MPLGEAQATTRAAVFPVPCVSAHVLHSAGQGLPPSTRFLVLAPSLTGRLTEGTHGLRGSRRSLLTRGAKDFRALPGSAATTEEPEQEGMASQRAQEGTASGAGDSELLGRTALSSSLCHGRTRQAEQEDPAPATSRPCCVYVCVTEAGRLVRQLGAQGSREVAPRPEVTGQVNAQSGLETGFPALRAHAGSRAGRRLCSRGRAGRAVSQPN